MIVSLVTEVAGYVLTAGGPSVAGSKPDSADQPGHIRHSRLAHLRWQATKFWTARRAVLKKHFDDQINGNTWHRRNSVGQVVMKLMPPVDEGMLHDLCRRKVASDREALDWEKKSLDSPATRTR